MSMSMSSLNNSTRQQAIDRLIRLDQDDQRCLPGHDPFDLTRLLYQGYDKLAGTEPVQQATLQDPATIDPVRRRTATYTLPTPPTITRQRIIDDNTPSKGSNIHQVHNSGKTLWSSHSSDEMNLQSSNFQLSPSRVLLNRNPVLTHENSQDIHRHKTSQFFTTTGAYTTCERPSIDTNDMPVLGGIALVSVFELPDRIRPVFPYDVFNRMQSKCFGIAYSCDENLVISAPTGSGKTTIFELAICRLATTSDISTRKIVYLGPTKALCEERHKDWSLRLRHLGITCSLLTGDSAGYDQYILRDSQLIITTPEKWDSITRKWLDQEKLMEMVRLMLVDEIHILNDDRGATVEAVVTRMKVKGKSVRFLAVSATTPNSRDIAVWLGKNSKQKSIPAHLEVFGDEFRPVRLQRFIEPIQCSSGTNDFAFNNLACARLPQIIAKYSIGKPIMVFCMTRATAEDTAKKLATAWRGGFNKLWHSPSSIPDVQNETLRGLVATGVAFHHGSLNGGDRKIIEKAYVDGHLSVICCTSTLAVGVNLPCHLVIINNTVKWSTDAGFIDYSDLDITQMLGRAGRPQFGDEGVGVIMTRLEKVDKYSCAVQGQQPLESRLHANLIEHLATEITLGTVRSLKEAKSWLKSTFFYVRLKQNQDHYFMANLPYGLNFDEQLEHICTTSISALCRHKLVESQSSNTIKATEFGGIMTKHCLQFKTMVSFIDMPPEAKVTDILATLCLAEEFRGLEMRRDERTLYSTFRERTSTEHSPERRVLPSKGKQAEKVNDNAEKISLVVRTALGNVDYPSDPQKPNFRSLEKQYRIEVSIVLPRMLHLVRCLLECRRILQDGISVRSALALSRSLAGGVWDDSQLVLKQLENVGPATVSKLRSLGIRTFDELRNAPVEQVDRCGRTSLFGTKLIAAAREVPALRITGIVLRRTIVQNQLRIHCRIDVGFFNTVVPRTFRGKRIRLSLLILRSDGLLVDCRQINDLGKDSEMAQNFSAGLDEVGQSIICQVACEELAGTLQTAVIRPDIPAADFPTRDYSRTTQSRVPSIAHAPILPSGVSRESEFGGDDLVADDFLAIEATEFQSIDDYDVHTHGTSASHLRNPLASRTAIKSVPSNKVQNGETAQYAERGNESKESNECGHLCKDKSTCAHPCCQEGRKNPRRKPRPSKTTLDKNSKTSTRKDSIAQIQGQATTDRNHPTPSTKAVIASTSTKQTTSRLSKLHDSVNSQSTFKPLFTKSSATKPVLPQQPLALNDSLTGTVKTSKDWWSEMELGCENDQHGLAQGAVSPASSTATLREEILDPRVNRKRHRPLLDFLSEDESDDFLPRITGDQFASEVSRERQNCSYSVQPKKRICHAPSSHFVDDAPIYASYASPKETLLDDVARDIKKHPPPETTDIPCQPIVDQVEQMSQEIASYQPFKSAGGIDPAFMAQFEDCCEFVD